MNSRLVLYISILLACAAVAVAAVRIRPAATARPPAAHASLPPHPSSYLGVYEDGAPPSYQPIAEFAQRGGQAAQPGRVTSAAGPAVRHGIRQPAARSTT